MGGTTPLLTDEQFKNLFETKGAAGAAEAVPTPTIANLPKPSTRQAAPAMPKPALSDDQFDKLFGSKGEGPAEGVSGHPQEFTPQELGFQPKLDQNNELLRAQNQGWFEQAAKTVGNTVVNIPLDILQSIGYTGTLIDGKNDYTNPLVDAVEAHKNPFGEVYREHPDQTFDLADPAWWMNNIGGFAEGAAQFAIPGEAEAAGIGELVKGVSEGMKLTKATTEAMMGAGQVISSSHLGYVMAAQSGRQMYQETYNTNYQRLTEQGIDPFTADAQAKAISSKAAATTVQLGTALNAVFGLAALSPLFKNNENKLMKWLGENGSRQEGESMEAWKARLSEAASDPDFQAALKTRPLLSLEGYPAQGLQIGLQGVAGEYATKAGQDVANGKSRDNIDYVSDFFGKVSDSEGALNFLTGVLGGPAHALLIDNLPLHRVIKYDDAGNPIAKDGTNMTTQGGQPKYETKLMSARTRDEQGGMAFFNSMKDAINKDVDWYTKKRQDLADAVKANDHVKQELLKTEMYNVANLHAVSMGLGDNWKKEYQDIGALDNRQDLGQKMQPQIDELQKQLQGAPEDKQKPIQDQLDKLSQQQQKLAGKTDAMVKGFAYDTTDNEYKSRATKAITDLEWMKKRFDDVRNQYVSMHDPYSEHLANNIFQREAELHMMRGNLDDERARIDEYRGSADTQFDGFALRDEKHLKDAEDKYAKKQADLDHLKSHKGQKEFKDSLKKEFNGQKKAMEDKNLKDNTNAFKKQQDMTAAARVNKEQLQSQQGDVNGKIRTTLDRENQIKTRLGELQGKRSTKATHTEINQLTAELAGLRAGRVNDSANASALGDAAQQAAKQEDTAANMSRDAVTSSVGSAQPVVTPETQQQAPQLPAGSEPHPYQNLKDQLTPYPDLHSTVSNLENLQDPANYSYDLTRNSLSPYVEHGSLSEDLAHEITMQQKDYLEGTQAEQDRFNAMMNDPDMLPIPLPEPLADTITPPSVDDITGPAEPFSPVVNMNPAVMPTPEEVQQIDTHIGAKALDSMKVNTAAIQYMEVVRHPKGRASYHTTLPLYDKLDPDFNPNILKPGFISAGDSLRFEVDTAWKGKINYDRSLETDEYGGPLKRSDEFDSYTDGNGKIVTDSDDGFTYANAPIKIVHEKSGETIGYLPRTDWITAQVASEGYRNMVDSFQRGEELVENNVEAQRQKLLIVRRIIALAHNGEHEPIRSTVNDRDSGGHIFYSTEVNRNTETSKLTPKLAKNLLPDPSIKFGMLNGRTVYTGHNTPLEGGKNFTEDDMARFGKGDKEANNTPMVILPMPNGKSSVSPMYTRSLSERPADINTIARAIEAHLHLNAGSETKQHEKWANVIHEATGAGGTKSLDIANPRDLETFINQYYTYTRHFSQVDTAIDAKAWKGNTSRKPTFMLDIEKDGLGDNPPQIKVGTSFSGTAPVYASLGPDGKLDPHFEDALKEGLGTHYKNVVYTRGDMRGLNDERPFHTVTINSRGIARTDKFDNYNHYLKSFADTMVYGKHQAEDGTYLYGANPIVNFDFDKIVATHLTPQDQEPATRTEEITPEEEDDIFKGMLLGNPALPGQPAPKQQADPIPPKTLEDIIGDTPRGSSLESITKNIGKLYDEAAANPDHTYQLDLPGDPKAKIKMGDKSTITMTQLASIMDSQDRPIPYNIKLSDDFMSILQNTPKRFLNNLLFEDSSMYAPLPYDEKILGQQIKEMFVPVRDASGAETGVFDAQRQTDVVGSILQSIKYLMDTGKGPSTAKGYKDMIKDKLFAGQRDKYDRITKGQPIKDLPGVTPEQAANLRDEYDKVLRSFDGPGTNFWQLTVDKLAAIGIKVIDRGKLKAENPDVQPRLTADGTDPLDGAFAEEAGHGLRDWSDVSFETDPKDTATGRLKMEFATVPDSKVGEEDTPREVSLAFSDPRIRQRVVQGAKQFTTRTPDQVKEMGLEPGKDVVAKVDGKLFRVTPVKVMDDNDAAVHEQIGKEEGTIPQPGDTLLQLKPYVAEQNVLTTNKNYLGLSKMADYEQLFETTIGKLAGVLPATIDNYIKILRDAGNQYNPNLRALAERLERAPVEVCNEFVSVASLQYQPFGIALLDSKRDNSGTSYNVVRFIDANRGSQINSIVDTWQQNQKYAPILRRNKAGVTVIDGDKASELKAQLSEVNTAYSKMDPTAQGKAETLLRKLFEMNGITMPEKAITSFINNAEGWTKKTSVSGSFRRQFQVGQDGTPLGVVSSMILKLSGQESANDAVDAEDDKSFMLTNPLYTEKNSISVLARVAAAHSSQLYSNTHRSSEGKSIYDYGFNTSLSRTMQRIKGDATFRSKFNDVDFAKSSWLLTHLNNDPQLRERFTLNYFDGIKVAYMPGASGVTRPDMSDREQALSSIGMFINQGDPKYAHYLSLTHSDKTTTPVFRDAPRVAHVTVSDARMNKVTGQNEGIYRLSDEAMGHLNNIFNSEYDRIMRAKEVGEQGGYNNPKYEKGSQYFYLIPSLNYDEMKKAVTDGTLNQKVFEKVWIAGKPELNQKEAAGFKQAVQHMITRHVEQMTSNVLDLWNKNDIIGKGDTPFDRRYLTRLLSGVGVKGLGGRFFDMADRPMTKEQAHDMGSQLAARDYAVNSFLMNSSMMQLMYGDPAQVWKGSVDKTMVEYGKRLAGPIAPGRELAFKPGEQYTSITAKDFKTSAPYLAEIEGLGKYYAEGRPLESTDAQELTSIQEHIDIMHAAGRITSKVYTDMSKIIKDANGKYYEFNDPVHKRVIMQPEKPVYYGDRTPNQGALLNDYIKSSSYPLYPPFLVGKELDKVRTAMETGGVARINFESAHKIGVPTSPVELFDEQGRVNEDVFKGDAWQTSARQQLSRDNFRIQQEVPYDEDKDSIRTVSQMDKLITQGIPLVSTPFTIGHQSMSAKDVIRFKEDTRKALFEINQSKLADKIGAKLQDGKMVVTDRNKLFDVLEKRALDGNLGFTANDVAYLKEANRLPHTDELVIPLMYAPSASKFEAMLMSLTSEIGNVRMPGHSYIQASPAGQQSVKKWEDMSESEKKQVMWVGDYDGSALKTVRLEDGKIKPAQIIVPWPFSGKPEDYMITGEDGKRTLDPAKIPPELLRMIGARIPNQGHNSMLPLEIAGFVPANMGDLAIVPAAITKQMGSDFDVDKLYTYHPAYQVKDGVHSLSDDHEDQLKNDYFDTHWGVLTHPDMIKSILNPLDKDDLKQEGALIEKWEQKQTGSKPAFADPTYQLRDFQAQKDAKRLVALASLSVTFNSTIQDKQLRPGEKVIDDKGELSSEGITLKIEDESGRIRKLSDLSGYGRSVYKAGEGDEGIARSKHDNHTTVQSESVDYAKNKVSDKVHLSTATYPASAALTQLQEADKGEPGTAEFTPGWAAHLGFNARLLSQPIIQDYVRELSKRGDSLSGDFTPDMKNIVAQEIIKDYNLKAEGAKEKEMSNAHVVSYKDLTDSLSAPARVDSFFGKQIKALELFQQLDQVGQRMMEAQRTINHDTAGAGSTLLDTMSKEQTRSTLVDMNGKDGDIKLMNAEQLYRDNDGRVTQQGALYDMIHDAAHAVVGGLFPYKVMMPIFDRLMQHTNRTDLSVDTQKNVFDSVKSFIFTHPQLGFWDNPQVTRANLLYRREGNPSLADRVHEAKQTWGQDNYFLSRLAVDVDPDNLHPSHVTYQASKASRLDDYENTKAWLDMFLDQDPTHQKLAEDLVRYSYLTGGNQDTRSFVKYIPYSYLVGTDFGHKLRELTGRLNSMISENPNFTEQWFQHNPQFAKSLSKDLSELGSKVEKYPERFSLPPIDRENPKADTNPARNMVVQIKTEGMKVRTPAYPDFLSYRSKDENRWILYKKTGREDYTRIDTLGDKSMDEYSLGDGLSRRSLIPENRSRAYDNIEKAFREIGNPLSGKGEAIRGMNIPMQGDYESMMKVLNNISSDQTLPEHARTVASFLSQMPEDGMAAQIYNETGSRVAPEFRFTRNQSEDPDHAGIYDIFSRKLTLSDKALHSPAMVAETLNHELIHHHTATIVGYSESADYHKGVGREDDTIHFIKGLWDEVSDKHSEIRKAVDDLNEVRTQAEAKLKEYAEGKGINYEQRKTWMFDKGVQTDLDRLIYSMSSNTEFITGALTHDATMRFLNQHAFKGDKSFMARAAEVVKDILSSIGRALGIGPARGSLLEAAIERSLKLMTVTAHSDQLTPEKMSTPDNMTFALHNPISTANMQGLDKIIGKLQEQKDELTNSMTGRLSKEDMADKRSKIDDIDNDLTRLNGELSTEIIGEIGRKHLGWVEKVIKTDKPSNSQVMTASRVLETWTNIINLLYDGSNTEVDKEFSDIYGKAQAQRNALTTKMTNTMINASDGVIGIKDFNSNNLVDIPRAQALSRSVSSAANSKVTQYVATYMETVGRRAEEDIVRNTHKAQALEQEMTEIAGGKHNLKRFYNKFFQDNDDHSAWGLVQRFHQNWFDYRREMTSKRGSAIDRIDKDPSLDASAKAMGKQRIWQKYWKDMNDQASFADTRLLFDSKTGEEKTDAAADKHRAELERDMGKPAADELIQEAKERYGKYLEQKQQTFDDLDGDVAAGDRPQDEADRLKDEFVSRYSPNVFFNNFRNPLADFKGINSDYYVRMAPKRTANEGKFYDEKFDEIQANPRMKAVYDKINDTLSTLKESLPVSVQQTMGKNFMPVIAKSLFADMINVPGYLKGLPEKMVHDLTASAQEELEADKHWNKIPIRMVADDRKNLPLESRSRDIPRLLEAFGMMALHYKHYADAKDFIDMGEQVLHEIDKVRTTGGSQVEQNGRFVTVDGGLRNTLDALKYMKDHMMYKKSRDLEGKTETMLYSANPAKQFKMAHAVKDLVSEREKLQQQMIDGDIDPADAMEKISEINKQLALYPGRRLYGSKLGDKLLTINQLKTLSYNPFSAVANVGFGVISAAIHANGGTDFSWRELGQAYKMMGSSMIKWGSFGSKDSVRAGKVLAIMDRLGIIGDVIDSHYGKVKTREREPGWQKAVNPYNWMRSGDYYMKGLTTVAMMLHDKIDVTENGEAKKVSIWEALDNNGQWNKARFGDNEKWQSEDLSKQTDLDKFRNKAVRVNMIIHGNQDKNSPKLANKYVLGRLIGQFRMSWLPEGWYSRFESEKFDIQLGRTIKGRYATIKDLGIMGYAAVTLKQMASIISKVDPYTGVSRLDGKPMSDVDISNMRRNFAELGFIAGMAGVIVTLKSAIDPDGDDKLKWALRTLSNQLIRNQQDLDFYASPGVFDAITKSVIPASEVFKDYWKAMKATMRVMTDSDYEADKWILAITHAGLPIPQATLVNKIKTSATRDLDTLQQ